MSVSIQLFLLLLGVLITPSIASDSNDAPTFNVKTYGAKGDGVTDDSDAVDQAVNALQSSGQGTLYFPSGTYLFAQHSIIYLPFLYIETTSGNVTVAGDGVDSTILVWNMTGASGFLAFIDAHHPVFVVRDLTIEGLPLAVPPTPEVGPNVFALEVNGSVTFQSIRVNSPPLSFLSVLYADNSYGTIIIDDVEMNGSYGLTKYDSAAIALSDYPRGGRLNLQVNNLRGTSDGQSTAFYVRGTIDGTFSNLHLTNWSYGISATDIDSMDLEIATAITITDSLFNDMGVAINLYGNGTVFASNCIFSADASQFTSNPYFGTGVSTGNTGSRHVLANLTVVSSQFTGLTHAAYWQDGHLSIRDSIITNTDNALQVDQANTLPNNINTFTLEGCKISNTLASSLPVVYLAQPMSNFIIRDNQCSGTATGIQAPCISGCVNVDNPGCGSSLVAKY